MVTDHGRMLDFGSGQPLAGAQVTEGTATTTSDADGHWTLQVPVNTPLQLSATKDGYITAHYPEEIYSADNNRGDLPLPDLMTFRLAQYAQPGYDVTKASISIEVRTMPSCASDQGATLTVSAPDGTSVVYFKGGFPTKTATAVSTGEEPAISVYNVPAGSDLTYTLTHPTCTLAPFPVTLGSATYTGKVVTEAGNANSALVFYLQ